MGDASRVPVAGYGTGRIKLDGHVVCMENSLHVPSLESSLFSTTKHARNGTGNTFLLSNSQMYLTFPNFSIEQPIPPNGDLRLNLEHLTENDWGIPSYVCNGEENDLEHLDNFGHRLFFLNKIFRGRAVTRAKQKE